MSADKPHNSAAKHAADPADERDAPQDLFEDVGKKVQALDLGQRETEVSPGKDDGEDQRVVDEIESLCMECHENGTTRLLLTRIPYFREIILMSFSCPHCGFRNSEIQAAGEIQEHGTQHSFTLVERRDLSRQVVKSDTCVAKVVEIGLEIPAGRGQLTNVEGLLTTVVEDLEFHQPARRRLDPDAHAKVDGFIQRARSMLDGDSFPFTVMLDDPAGNSWIEPSTDNADARWSKTEYKRTPEQNEALALGDASDNTVENQNAAFKSDIVPDELYSFPSSCPGCGKPCPTHMKLLDIPHFKEVVVMSTVCDHCGYRSNEIKTGGAIPAKGSRISLRVKGPRDLGRDILKSETCALSCPELGLSINPGTLGGRFTTVEGLLTQVRDDLRAQIFDADGVLGTEGDSVDPEEKARWDRFFGSIDKGIAGERPFTIVLEDPMAASYVQNLCVPDKDPQLLLEEYERTNEENEDLGLNDINVEGYAEEEGSVTKNEDIEEQSSGATEHHNQDTEKS